MRNGTLYMKKIMKLNNAQYNGTMSKLPAYKILRWQKEKLSSTGTMHNVDHA